MPVIAYPAPQVSVLIPAHDAEATLAETLASAAAQTFREIEIIVVDDGSHDATAHVAEHFAASDPRVRVLRQDNRGVAAARNRAIAEARGKWIAPLDADDLWHPDKLALQVAAAGQAGFVYCWSRDIDSQGRVWRDGPQARFRGHMFLRMLAHNFIGNGSVLLVRRDAAQAVGGYDESLRAQAAETCADVLFQLRLAERFAGEVVPAWLVGYRQRANSMSADPSAGWRAWLAARSRLALASPAARHADRLGQARRKLLLAEGKAWQGQWGKALRPALGALADDPLRFAAMAGGLLARRLTRTEPAMPLPFVELDTERPLTGSRGLPDVVERLDTRRNRALTAWESH